MGEIFYKLYDVVAYFLIATCIYLGLDTLHSAILFFSSMVMVLLRIYLYVSELLERRSNKKNKRSQP